MSSVTPAATSFGTVMALLRAGVPLTLLLDLLRPDPRSAELYATERPAPSRPLAL